MGADVLDEFELDAEDGAVFASGDFVVVDMAAALGGGLKMFPSAFDPFDGYAELAGEEADEELFGVDVGLAAEAAADFGSNDAHFVLGDAENGGGDGAEEVGNLGGGVKGEGTIGAFVIADGAAGFHGIGDDAGLEHALFDDNLGIREGLVDFAVFVFMHEGDVIGPFGMDGRRTGGESFFRVGDGG